MTQQVIDPAKAILMARRGCTREQAFWLLSTGAREHEMKVSEFAACTSPTWNCAGGLAHSQAEPCPRSPAD